jgi:hypothetical protein
MSPIELLVLMLVFAGFAQSAGKDVKKAQIPFIFAVIFIGLTLLQEAVSVNDDLFGSSGRENGYHPSVVLFHTLSLISAWVGAWRVITSKK